MSNYLQSFYTNLNNLVDIVCDLVTTVNLLVTGDTILNTVTVNTLHIIDFINLPLNFMWTNLINQPIDISGTNQISVTNFNGNITQSSGSTQLNDVHLNNITQSGVIVQSSNDWNLMKKTQITELEVLETLILPSDVIIAGSTHTSDMILIDSTIQQSLTTTPNTFMATDIYDTLRVSGNIEQIGGADTHANLKNLTVTGPSNFDIINSITIDTIHNVDASQNVAISQNTNDIIQNTNDISQNAYDITQNTNDISQNAYDITQNTNDISQNAYDITQNTNDISQNTFDINLLKDVDISQNIDISQNKFDISGLQQQVNDIIGSEYYETISIGTVTTLNEGELATVTNSGTSIHAILDFAIPMGYRGYKGDKGDKGDRGSSGSDGKDGSNGSNGSQGPQGPAGSSLVASAAAGAAAASAAAAATAATNSAASATGSAASASSSAASASLATTKVQELEVKVGQLDLEVANLDTDVTQVNTKTQYISTGAGITTINSTLNTNELNVNSAYVANDLIVVDEVKASSFSGGLGNTVVKGSNINIGTNETLINTVNIGQASTVTTINGIVIFTNPFSNSFSQW